MSIVKAGLAFLLLLPAIAFAQAPAAPADRDEGRMDALCFAALLMAVTEDNRDAGPSSESRLAARGLRLGALEFFGGRLSARYPVGEIASRLGATQSLAGMASAQSRAGTVQDCSIYHQATMLSVWDAMERLAGRATPR